MPEFTASLGPLADPRCFTEPLDIAGCDADRLVSQLRLMLLIRRVEEQIGDMVLAKKIVGPAHLGIGQEAIAVGISEHLNSRDRVFGAHRSHAHYLALGGDVFALLAEVLGKEAGCSKGMGGSMHLYGAACGFYGSVPIVAGTVALAVGAALAARKDGSSSIAVAYFGDGAAEEGVIQESLNLASAWELPVLFVCENNLFASHLHIGLRQPADRIARIAAAHCMPAATVDGNDVAVVSRVTAQLVAPMRAGGGPAFLEAVTYRWRGHVGPSEDNDVGVNRGSDLALWKHRDPVGRLRKALERAATLDETGFARIDLSVREQVRDAWSRAETAGYPKVSALLESVYAQTT